MEKIPRAGYNCYRQAVTLTFKRPTTYKFGLFSIAYFMSKQRTIRDFVFYPEYGKNANFHLHGTVWYSNKVHFYSMINRWKKYIGFVKLKDINNIVGWHIYCTKDRGDNPHYFKRCHKYNYNSVMERYHPIAIKFD